MRLKTCKNIEIALCVVRLIIMLPLLPLALLALVCGKIWEAVYDFLSGILWNISNRILRNCDEVKDGTIRDTRYKNLTSLQAYEWLKASQRKELNQKQV